MSDSDAVDDASGHTEKASIPGFGPRPEGAEPSPQEPQASTHSMRNVLLVLGGVVLVAIVVCLVLVLLFFTVIGDAVDDVESSRNETAITAQQYASIEVGMRESAVRDKLGEPDNETTGSGQRETTCLYYNEKDAGLIAGDRYKFCFVDGRLNRKSKD
ncbi:MAG: hypothetical protein L0K86_09205 [Actinomycetia bacterium]|nr:hypothetical protein [Actinomycetes bacterium]